MVTMSTKKTSKRGDRGHAAAPVAIDSLLRDLVTVEQAMHELGFRDPRRVQQLCKQGRLGRMFLRRCIITRQELDEFKKLERPSGIRKEFHVKRA